MHADRLVSAGLQPSSIGIITPYNAQVRFRLGRLICPQAACKQNAPELSEGCCRAGGCRGHRLHLQVHLIKDMRADTLSAMEISSVDGFQGREKEAIIISMVQSAALKLQALDMHIKNGQQRLCSIATSDLHSTALP